MGANASQSVEKVPLRVMVDKKRNKVLYAEAGKDFVDVLFSFLTLPLGTIARLVAQESNIGPVRVGCLSSLYQGVADLKEEHLWTPTCKEMLLKPRNSMESYCRHLKLNIDDTEPMQYFICEDWDCSRRISGSLLSNFRNQICSCGKVMNRELSQPKCLKLENGFVKDAATFLICDDLYVLPNVLGTSVHLLQNLGVHNIGANIEEQTVDIGKKEIVDLLKLSLISKTPLTDLIFKRNQFLESKLSLISKTPLTDLIFKSNQFLESFNRRNQSKFGIREVPSDKGRQMSVKVMVRKSNGEILFAQAEEDFADFLFNFLTFPLGMFKGYFSTSCMDNLYKSMTELSPERYLRSQELKNKLAKPQIAPQFELSNQILPVGTTTLPKYCCRTYHDGRKYNGALTTSSSSYRIYHASGNETVVLLNLVDPKFSISKSSGSGEFAKGPSMYMVTDDLVVTPMSSLSAISYLNRSKVPLSDLEERVIKVGPKEGLCILKVLMTSTSALTDGLNQFIRTIKEEK